MDVPWRWSVGLGWSVGVMLMDSFVRRVMSLLLLLSVDVRTKRLLDGVRSKKQQRQRHARPQTVTTELILARLMLKQTSSRS